MPPKLQSSKRPEMMQTLVSRRTLLLGGSAGAVSIYLSDATIAQGRPPPVLTRPIPVSGEPMPIVGIGTYLVFEDENDPAKHAERKAVLETLSEGGGKLIDTAPAYGNAELKNSVRSLAS